MGHYLSNKDLAEELRRCQISYVVSDRLAQMLMLLVERLSLKGNWRQYSYLDEMKSEALLQLIKANDSNGQRRNDYRPNILKFDFSYAERAGTPPNPFAYATQIIVNVFRRHVKLETELGEFRDDCLEAARLPPSFRRQAHNDLNRSSEPIPIKVKVKQERGPYKRPPKKKKS